MIRTTHLMLLQRGGSRRIPRSITDMPSASLRHGWGDIGRMTPQDRRELLRGEWTNARPVRLIPNPVDRDAGGFVEGVSFANDDEAAAFLAQEDADDAVERTVSTMQLARHFFEELALTSDTEVDVENVMEADIESDEERAEEARDAHRRFFAEYYERQGLVTGAEGQRLVDIMTGPPGLLLIVNSAFPFVRFVTLWQLLRHAQSAQSSGRGAVFTQHPAHPLLFSAELFPRQSTCDPMALLNTSNSPSALPPNEPAGVSVNECVVAQRQDDMVGAETTSREAASLASFLEDEISCVPEVSGVHQVMKSSPLTIGHMYWLQRQVAADTLIDSDLLGVLIPLLLRVTSAVADTQIILDMSSRSYRMSERFYSKDIASYMAYPSEGGESSVGYVVISLVSPNRKVGCVVGSGTSSVASRKCHVSARADEEDVPAANSSAEGCLRSGAVELQFSTGYHAGVEGHVLLRAPPRQVHEGLRGNCNYVLCCPDTTADGCKPRYALGVSGAMEGEEEGEGNAVVNRFVSVCPRVNKLFHYLRSELMQALQYANPRCGRVVYATHSLNPLENEAVVASVLTDLSRESSDRVYHLIPLPEGDKGPFQPLEGVQDKEAFDTDALTSLSSIISGGRSGLRSWVPLEGGQPEQDPSYCDDRIVADVARCSWRSDPLSAVEDVCYVCVIEVRTSPNRVLPATFADTPGSVPTGEINSEVHCTDTFFPWCDLGHLREHWGLTLCCISGENNESVNSGCVACTVAVKRVVDMLDSRNNHEAGCGVVKYGIRVDECPAIHRRPNEGGDSVMVRASLSGTLLSLALCDSVREEHRISRVLWIPAVAVIELLHTGNLTSMRLRELQDARRGATNTLADVGNLLAKGSCTVFLRVEVPKPFSSVESHEMELHEDLQAELRKLVLVATANMSYDASTRSPFIVFKIEGMTSHEHSVLRERVVAISDALQYLLRRLGYPADIWDPTYRDNIPEATMQDDEYEVEPSSSSHYQYNGEGDEDDGLTTGKGHSLLGRQAELQHERRMQRMEKALRSLGAAVDGSAVNDWEKDVQRWRRGYRPLSVGRHGKHKP
ncbi:uncharacterized protein TEOVI_000500300 [Trypanosoma equiperdum]|uniref:Uncharacterized protein n=1 Tax=Trypanosoma equiperdum TaxID=5694 RepID=A0A1G4I6J7_TRYEQ|nr:hypothetical protein, conserved [Trypanosoma equiperdum]